MAAWRAADTPQISAKHPHAAYDHPRVHARRPSSRPVPMIPTTDHTSCPSVPATQDDPICDVCITSDGILPLPAAPSAQHSMTQLTSKVHAEEKAATTAPQMVFNSYRVRSFLTAWRKTCVVFVSACRKEAKANLSLPLSALTVYRARLRLTALASL